MLVSDDEQCREYKIYNAKQERAVGGVRFMT